MSLLQSAHLGDAGSVSVDPNRQALVQWASGSLPTHCKKVQVHKYVTCLLCHTCLLTSYQFLVYQLSWYTFCCHLVMSVRRTTPEHAVKEIIVCVTHHDPCSACMLLICRQWAYVHTQCIADCSLTAWDSKPVASDNSWAWLMWFFRLFTHVVLCCTCRLSSNFREATKVVSQALPSSIPAGHVLLRVAFAGVNASDVNFSSGRYHPSIQQAQASLPFDAGFEAVGAVAAVGQQVSGSPCAVMQTTNMTHVHARLNYTSASVHYRNVSCLCMLCQPKCAPLAILRAM